MLKQDEGMRTPGKFVSKKQHILF